MCTVSFRGVVGAAIVIIALGALEPAWAEPCANSCTLGRGVCGMQAHTSRAACDQACAAGDDACHAACVVGARATRLRCQATRVDCLTTCPAPADDTAPCPLTCSATAQSCFAQSFAAARTCVQRCKADGGPALTDCLSQCAATIGSARATCLAAFQGCLSNCAGQTAGGCFSTVALACTAEACGPDQPCAQPNEFCSPRCGIPPLSGTCFDLHALQCTTSSCSPTQPCGDGQTCVPLCPPPLPRGTCFDPRTHECSDASCDATHACATGQVCTLQCPKRTPPPQCASVPCGGPCAISPPCAPGGLCPAIVSRLGQCGLDTDGACACVPASPPPSPTPQPTPTPQCAGPVCGGTCFIGPTCHPGQVCPLHDLVVRPGECSAGADGSCQCVAIRPPTPTPACTSDDECDDGIGCTADRCANGVCTHVCVCVLPGGGRGCCAGPSALCVRPCGSAPGGSCGGACPFGASCEASANPGADCRCVSGPGGPCGGNIRTMAPVCAPGLVCRQQLPDVGGFCEKSDCVPLFTSGCDETADCCMPCLNGTHAPCGVCLNGACNGAP